MAGQTVDISGDGVIASSAGLGITDIARTTVPAANELGFAHGCICRKVNGAASTDAVYFNVGTKEACNFVVVDPSALSGLLATVDEINRAADVSTRIVTLAGSTVITPALHEGKICKLTGTGAAFTQELPAATGSGARYTFIVGAVNTSGHIIGGVGGDILSGNIWTNSSGDAPDLGQPWLSTSNLTITLNGTTSGGSAVGDVIELVDIASGVWHVLGHTTSSGAEETPFSGS